MERINRTINAIYEVYGLLPEHINTSTRKTSIESLHVKIYIAACSVLMLPPDDISKILKISKFTAVHNKQYVNYIPDEAKKRLIEAFLKY